MHALPAFLGIAVLVIVTPGPDTAVTIRSALAGGRRSGIAIAGGVALGQIIWALATSAGLAALLLASEPLFAALRYAGALYLVVLGLLALRAALSPGSAVRGSGKAMGGATLHPTTAFRHGLISDLGNPKMAAFFTSLLPQFGSSFLELFLLGLVFAAMTGLWLAGYAAALARFGGLLRQGPVRRWLDAVTGGVLVMLGLRLAAGR